MAIVTDRAGGEGQDIRTVLLAELDERAHTLVGGLLRDVPAWSAGASASTIRREAGQRTLCVVFGLASDAAVVAVRVLREQLRAKDRAMEDPGGEVRLRMALATGPTVVADAMPGGPALTRADQLLEKAFTGQALLAASTAVLVGPTLPPGAEMYDRGYVSVGQALPAERVYELRLGVKGLDGRREETDGASSLEWARRAADRLVLGREAPLADLDLAWRATLRGDRRAVLLVGEGGIGKTTVLAELALRLHAEGALVLYGRWDQERHRPYQAIREALGAYAGTCPEARLREDLSGHGGEIARLLREVGQRIGGAVVARPADPESERFRLFTAIRAWLYALARRRPVLLILDDFHAAVRPSQLLVEHLLQALGDAPLMIAVAGRPADGKSSRTAISDFDPQFAGLERIVLGGLDSSVVATLIEDSIGRPLTPADDRLVDWLKAETAGNPLFLREALASLRRAPNAAEALDALRREVPERMADLVWWRVTQLSADAVDALVDASVVGGTFDLDLLAAATGLPAVQVRRSLDEIVRAGWLRAEPSPDSTADRFSFTHEVVCRVLRDGLPEDRVAVRQRRIAAALAQRARAGEPVSEAEVADRFLLGVNHEVVDDAVGWARRAARAARDETAFEVAAELLSRAFDTQERLAGLGRRVSVSECELGLDLAQAYDQTGEFAARDARYLDAADLARSLDRTDLFVRAALGFGGRLPMAAPPNPTATALLREALDRLPATDLEARALVLARLALLPEPGIGRRQRLSRSDDALAITRQLDAPAVVAAVLAARSLAFDGPDDTEEQLAIGAEVTRIGEGTGDLDLVLQGARARIPALLATGRYEEACELAETFTELAHGLRHPDHLRVARMWEILGSGLRGDYDRAEALAAELYGELRAAGHPQATIVRIAQAFTVRWFKGGLDDLRPELEAARTAGLSASCAWAMRTWIEAETGHPERARAELAEREPTSFIRGLERDFLWWPTMVACVGATVVGEPRWAAALEEALAAYAGRNCVVGFTAFAGAVDHHLGLLDLQLGRTAEAVRRLDRGLDRHRALCAAPFVALSARWLAQALRMRDADGDRGRAQRLDDESRSLAQRLDLRGLPELAAL